MKTSNSLHIIKLEASNIKKLKAVSITPEGKLVVVTGENDAGKTSVIDSIAYALGGKDMIAEVPIRQGASKARVIVDLDEIKVTRSFSALGGSTLVIEAKDGSPVRSPQTLLDNLCSRIAFDPLAFVRMRPADQLETLRKLVGLDFTKLDADRKKAYDERTLANRELANAKARASEVEVDPETPDEEVSVASLLERVASAQAKNQDNAKRRSELKALHTNINSIESEILKNNTEIQKLKEEIESIMASNSQLNGLRMERARQHEAISAEVNALVDEDTSPIHKQINEASTINAKVRDKKRFASLKAEVSKAEKRTEDLTSEIEAYDAAKTKQLSEAKFPLEGLSFDDTGVLLNGVPFTQGSQARQLQAAVAIGIAMNPKVRVILIRDGSLLDEKSLKMVAEMAEKNDMQIWIEIVQSNDPTAIVIEDGQVKEAD